MRVTSKGQVTIPQAIRERLGIEPGSEVAFEVDGDAVRITKLTDRERGVAMVERMRGRARGGRSTDAILALTRE